MLSAAMVFTSLSFGSGFTAHAIPVPDSKPYPNDAYYRKETLQPYGSNLQVDELKNWSPSNDPDARYNRSRVPLKERVTGPLVNNTASTEAKVVSLALTNGDAATGKSQGGDSATVYAFTNYQYVDVMNYWGGSSADGPIAIPTPEHIDAAHRNGVAATGTIFFPWGDSQFTQEAVNQFTEQDAAGNFIVADKMFEMAEYYGFEGFFINQESNISQSSATKLREMLAYIQENKPEGFIMQWYDAMTPSGSVSNLDQVNSQNIGMIQEGDTRYNDQVFLNFNWNSTKIKTSINTMAGAGRDRFDILATWENFPYSKDPGRISDLTNATNGIDGKLGTSLGFLGPSNTLVSASSPSDFQNNTDLNMWVNSAHDPRVDYDPSKDVGRNFPGVATVIADKTPILGTDFVTHFTAGNGYKFYEDGKVVRNREWYNRSMTDVMPTWKWIVESEGSKLQPEIDYSTAYWAGTSLKVAGQLDAGKPNHVKLYSSQLDIMPYSDLEVIYKESDAGVMQVGLCFGNTYDDKNFTFIDLNGEDAGNGWKKAVVDLSPYAGKTAIAISLKFSSDAAISSYSANVGKLAITTDTSAPGDVTKVTLDEYRYSDASHAEARLYWNEASGADYYKVYRIKADGSREMIGAVPNNAYYVSTFAQDGSEEGFDFEVVPITIYGTEGGSAKTHFNWDYNGVGDLVEVPGEDSGPNIAAGKPAVASNPSSSNGTAVKLTDGLKDRDHKWDSGGSAGIATIDLGKDMEVARFVLYHANNPDSREAWTYNTMDFEILYAADNGGKLITGDNTESQQLVYSSGLTFVSAGPKAKITGNTKDITNINLSTPITARYIQLKITRSCNSQWNSVRVPEMEVYSKPGKLYDTNINTENVYIRNNSGNGSDFIQIINVPFETMTGMGMSGNVTTESKGTVRIYDSLTAQTPVKTVSPTDTSGIITINDFTLKPEGGVLYFTVQNSQSGKDESLRIGIPYNAETGNFVPEVTDPEAEVQIPAESVHIQNNKYHGTVVIQNIPVGSRAKFFAAQNDLFPTLTSSVAQEVRLMRNGNAKIIQNRVELDVNGGSIWVEIFRNGKQISERFELTYGALDTLSIDMTKLEDLVNKYDGRTESAYSAGYDGYAAAMEKAKEALANGITGAGYEEKQTKLDALCDELQAAVDAMVRKPAYRTIEKNVDPAGMETALKLLAEDGVTEITDATIGDTVLVSVEAPEGYEFAADSVKVMDGAVPVEFAPVDAAQAKSITSAAVKARIAAQAADADKLTSQLYSFTMPRGSQDAPITVSVTFTEIPAVLDPSVLSVAVSPKTASLKFGETKQFTATVSVKDGAPETVRWTVTGNKDKTTQIDANGLLTVGAKETSAKLTVKATSTENVSKFDTAEVTVTPYVPDPDEPNPPEEPDDTYSISGQILEHDGTPAVGAAVTLMQGGAIATTVTDANGEYQFTGIEPGFYNVKAQAAGENRFKTTLVEIVDHNVTKVEIRLPKEPKNSEVNVNNDVPAIVAGGLDDIAESLTIPEGSSSITVKLDIASQKDPEQKAPVDDLAAKDNKEVGLYLDISLLRQIDSGTPENIGGNNSHLIEIKVPFETKGKRGITVYRTHDNDTTALKQGGSGERYELSDGMVTIFASKFSTYAIGYDKAGGIDPAPSRPSTSGGSSYYPSRIDENWIFVRPQGMGTVTPGDCTAYDGDDKTFTFTPDSGHKVGKVLLDGEEVATDGKSYTLRNITNPHTLTVIFVQDTAAENESSKPADPIKPDATPNAPTGVETPSLALLMGIVLMGGYFLARRARSVRKH